MDHPTPSSPPPNNAVQFADRSPSIIPTPIYNSPLPPPSTTFSSSSSITSTSTSMAFTSSSSNMMVPPSHTSRTTRVGSMHRSNFASDTFEEKTLEESRVFSQYTTVDEEHEMHTRGGGTGRSFSGNDKQGFLPLATHEEDPMAPPPPTQYGSQRTPLQRFLLGPSTRPWFSWTSALIMLVLLVVELIRNATLTGSVIQTSPSFNPMIGPSFYTLISMGAKFTPCMRDIPNYTTTTAFQDCYKTGETCTLATLCENVSPPSLRFLSPIFMHAGIVHYLLNMLTHLRLGVDLERALGLFRYLVLYLSAGLFGNVLSAMLAPPTQASMGASGALFGLIGYMFIDVIVNWKVIPNPVRELMSLLISTIISLILGLLPGLDNFAHLGGFIVGLVMGMMIAPMRPMASPRARWITWGLRLLALVLLIILFVVCLVTFYNSPDPAQICPGCKYLSCLPVSNWCDF